MPKALSRPAPPCHGFYGSELDLTPDNFAAAAGMLSRPTLPAEERCSGAVGSHMATMPFLPLPSPHSGSFQAFPTPSPGISSSQVHLPVISRCWALPPHLCAYTGKSRHVSSEWASFAINVVWCLSIIAGVPDVIIKNHSWSQLRRMGGEQRKLKCFTKSILKASNLSFSCQNLPTSNF